MSAPSRLGDMSIEELLRHASVDLVGLSEYLRRIDLGEEDRLLTGAYVGSIGAKVVVAETKVQELVDENAALRAAAKEAQP